MSEARSFDDWNHTSVLLAMLANTTRDPQSDPFHPADFHPYLRDREVRRDEVQGDAIDFLENIGL